MTTHQPTAPRRYWEPRIITEEEPMRRRRFIAAAVTATGVGILPGPLSAPAVAAPDRLNGSTTLPTILTDLAADIWNTSATYVDPASAPARADLMDVAHWQWAQAVVIANRAQRSPLAARARSIEAEAARQLAMMCADRFNYVAATKLYRQATGAALRAGDHELAAWIATSRAYMPLYTGNHPRVLDLSSTALKHLQRAERPGGRAAACAYGLLARTYAAQGDHDNTANALRHAYGAMSTNRDAGSATLPAAHHPQRFAWVKLRLATAEAYAALGDPEQHQRAYDAAMADPSVSAMHKPMLRLGQAEVTTDPAAAAREALTVLRGMKTPANPVIGRARALARRAAAKDPRNDDVQQLRIHLLAHAR